MPMKKVIMKSYCSLASTGNMAGKDCQIPYQRIMRTSRGIQDFMLEVEVERCTLVRDSLP
jgi:hypothetical protein